MALAAPALQASWRLPTQLKGPCESQCPWAVPRDLVRKGAGSGCALWVGRSLPAADRGAPAEGGAGRRDRSPGCMGPWPSAPSGLCA